MDTTTQYVFAFEDGDGKNKKLLGGKGANLCEMARDGLNVPPGFTITTAVCQEFYKCGKASAIFSMAYHGSLALPGLLARKRSCSRQPVLEENLHSLYLLRCAFAPGPSSLPHRQ